MRIMIKDLLKAASLASVLAFVCILSTPMASAQQNGIAGGREHTLALRSDGTVWTFGENSIGQLGNGTIISTYSNLWDRIAGVSNIVGISAGGLNAAESHSLLLRADGTVWGFGRNDDGELGPGV